MQYQNDIKFRTNVHIKIIVNQDDSYEVIEAKLIDKWKEFVNSDYNPTYNGTKVYQETHIIFSINTTYEENSLFNTTVTIDSITIDGKEYQMHLEKLILSQMQQISPTDILYEQRISEDNKRIHVKCWDRDEVLIKSNLSLNKDLYLGMRNTVNNPIQCYRMKSDDKEFWIELYSAENVNRHSVFPVRELKDETGKIIKKEFLDDLFIETIFCFDANAMI
jgi:hypothetical protein